MKLTIIIPHFASGKATAYSVSQFLKYKGDHELSIIVGDNRPGDGSIKYLEPFINDVVIVNYPTDKLQSHGILIDYILSLGMVHTDYFMTAESDSFPTKEFIDYHKRLIDAGGDAAGSVLRLSGGEYLHPCGAVYKKSVWEEAKKYCDVIPYSYFPNIAMKSGFASHLMVHNSILSDFIAEPEDFIELADGYKPYSAILAESKRQHYSVVVAPFHNGMGDRNEDVKTYGERTVISESANTILGNKKLIFRVGLEPGQWYHYYMEAMNKKIFRIPTEVKWLPGREGQQQEYTEMENGFRHCWAGSSYLDMKGTEMNDVYEFKKNQIEELYNSLPEHQKIIL